MMIYSQKYFLVTGILFLMTLLPFFLFAQTEERNASATVADNDPAVSTTSDATRPTTPPPARALPADTIRPIERKDNLPETTNQRDPRATPAMGEGRMPTTPRELEMMNRSSLEERKAQMEAKRMEMQVNQAERRAALEEMAQKRISYLAATMSNRMEEAIARMTQVIERIESRIIKLNERDVDTSEAERYLAATKSDLRTAAATLASIDTEVVTAITSTDPRNAWARVQTIYQSARDAIRSAHGNIRSAIEALKVALQAAEAERTETNTTSDTAE
jgi:hypothetical protein